MTTGWRFTDHACRACMGQVLQDGANFICSICRAEAVGSPALICGCGMAIEGVAGRRNAGFRCVANATPTPACPAHTLIVFDPVPVPVAA